MMIMMMIVILITMVKTIRMTILMMMMEWEEKRLFLKFKVKCWIVYDIPGNKEKCDRWK